RARAGGERLAEAGRDAGRARAGEEGLVETSSGAGRGWAGEESVAGGGRDAGRARADDESLAEGRGPQAVEEGGERAPGGDRRHGRRDEGRGEDPPVPGRSEGPGREEESRRGGADRHRAAGARGFRGRRRVPAPRGSARRGERPRDRCGRGALRRLRG